MGFRKVLTFLVILAILLSGCAEESTEPAPSLTPTFTATPFPSPTFTPTSKPTPTLTPTPLKLEYGVRYTVKVVYVVDGDTIDVIMPDGSKERIRILGIDTPEKERGRNKPGEYDAIDDLGYLSGWGQMATLYAIELLKGKTVQIEFDEEAGMRGYYGRLLAYVYVDGQDFGELMLKNGYARAYAEGHFKKRDYYIQLEEEAKASRIGLWNYSPPEVKIAFVHYDACGETEDRECLNDEYVVIHNAGSTAVSLESWTLKDEAGHHYLFPEYWLMPGSNVTVHTGKGFDNSTDLFWGSNSPIWNNDHDTAYLYNAAMQLVDEYAW